MQQRETFVEHAREALRQYREGAPPDAIPAFELTTASVAEWLARARRLLDERGSYREADIGEERCVLVATDPRAPLVQRIGSAAALSKASEDARSRVRVAIQETADPTVANALEDALEERDDPRALANVLRRS
jgi:hypothetical protein